MKLTPEEQQDVDEIKKILDGLGGAATPLEGRNRLRQVTNLARHLEKSVYDRHYRETDYWRKPHPDNPKE